MDVHLGPLAERRTTRRYRGPACGDIALRIRPGHHARLLDVSADGALVETGCRLMPGRWIDLQFRIGRATASTRAQVLRASIATLAAERVGFAGAVRFVVPLSWAGDLSAASIDSGSFPHVKGPGTPYPHHAQPPGDDHRQST